MIAQKYYHTVVRLPPYFCIFNPIEFMWAELKKRIRRKNVKPKFDRAVINLITEEVANITTEDWQKKIKKVIEYEDGYGSLGDIVTVRIGSIN
jgi:transposase